MIRPSTQLAVTFGYATQTSEKEKKEKKPKVEQPSRDETVASSSRIVTSPSTSIEIEAFLTKHSITIQDEREGIEGATSVLNNHGVDSKTEKNTFEEDTMIHVVINVHTLGSGTVTCLPW